MAGSFLHRRDDQIVRQGICHHHESHRAHRDQRLTNRVHDPCNLPSRRFKSEPPRPGAQTRLMVRFVAVPCFPQTQGNELNSAKARTFHCVQPQVWEDGMAGWGGRIRTSVWRNQKPASLA
jgi:hypothetical protein